MAFLGQAVDCRVFMHGPAGLCGTEVDIERQCHSYKPFEARTDGAKWLDHTSMAFGALECPGEAESQGDP